MDMQRGHIRLHSVHAHRAKCCGILAYTYMCYSSLFIKNTKYIQFIILNLLFFSVKENEGLEGWRSIHFDSGPWLLVPVSFLASS